ncbi:hypothetical protein [Streptomyces smaragdinus]|uniref:hypothetical protein n=1 Tax=Streptomyces smaragdinus TaxID=2585196 RepID=UPI001297180C|nr:hypothetical protein [Streptomyces smaragdinus]
MKTELQLLASVLHAGNTSRICQVRVKIDFFGALASAYRVHAVTPVDLPTTCCNIPTVERKNSRVLIHYEP